MAHVLPWRSAAVPAETAGQAAQALKEGGLVVFPTDTVYAVAASARHPDAVARLRRCTGRPDDQPLTVALHGPANLSAWVAEPGPLARRLARRCWPGPVTLAFAGIGPLPQPGEEVRGQVCAGDQLWLRVPGHAAFLLALRQLDEPIVMCDDVGLVEASQAVALGEEIALVIDDGPARSDRPATVVQIDGTRWQVLREGVVSADVLRQVAAVLIVFLCTGNTCRSPLAESLCKRLLADRLGCTVAELPQRGFVVLSAGLSVLMGQPAAEEAVRLAAECGVDLSGHVSQPLSEELAAQADYLLVMTQGHLQTVTEAFAELACRPRLLSPAGEDISDPIGGDREVYEACARQLRAGLEAFVADIPLG
jgi:L-threonylcarbamoyladenylate synthase